MLLAQKNKFLKMKLISSILLMMLGSFAVCLFFPWWSIAIVCLCVSIFIPQKRGISFLSGMSSLFFLWFGWSLWISTNNNHILAQRVSLLILKIDNPILLCFITGMIGGIIGGMAALTGSFFRPVSK